MTLLNMNGNQIVSGGTKYKDLLDIHFAIGRWDAATFFFLRKKRQEFYKLNGGRIETALNEIKKLRVEYCLKEVNKDGIEVFKLENGNYLFESDEKKQEYIDLYNVIVNQPCQILE